MITDIKILNVLVDNTNIDYQGSVIKIWWRLNCSDSYEFISYQCSTDFTPIFDMNFVSYENVTNDMLINWIISTEGENFDILKNKIEKSVYNQMSISLYNNSNNYMFLSR